MISKFTYELIKDHKEIFLGEYTQIELGNSEAISGEVVSIFNTTDYDDVLSIQIDEYGDKTYLLYTEDFIKRKGTKYVMNNLDKCVKSIVFNSSDKSVKPPIGLRPKYIVQSERLEEITQAIKRYVESNTIIPSEWVEEYNELVENLTKEGKL